MRSSDFLSASDREIVAEQQKQIEEGQQAEFKNEFYFFQMCTKKFLKSSGNSLFVETVIFTSKPMANAILLFPPLTVLVSLMETKAEFLKTYSFKSYLLEKLKKKTTIQKMFFFV